MANTNLVTHLEYYRFVSVAVIHSRYIRDRRGRVHSIRRKIVLKFVGQIVLASFLQSVDEQSQTRIGVGKEGSATALPPPSKLGK